MSDFTDFDNAIRYEPTTGLFFWKIRRGNRYSAGDHAGHFHPSSGYVVIGFRRKYYKAHRVAWLLFYGSWPASCLDHVNRIPSDNRIINLRECSSSDNQANRSANKNNSTGYRGVTFHKRLEKYQAAIRVNYGPIHLGTFDTAEQAAVAYRAAAAAHFGRFATPEILRTTKAPVKAERLPQGEA